MKNLMIFLDGKKTYIAGGLMILLGIVEKDLSRVLEGVTAICIRAGIKKI